MAHGTTDPFAADRPPGDVHGKALAINLDPSIYGSFAEIGAGQEVARWFLRVGAAVGTVAQTISAYDKQFSDETYGESDRYVSKSRLLAMLDREFELLVHRLGPSRGQNTRFFAFADTAAARSYSGDNEQHAWIGVRFQSQVGEAPSDLRLHVNLRDPTAQLQQESLGRLGVNLIYAAFHDRGTPDTLLSGIFDELTLDDIEIDVIELDGPAFQDADAADYCVRALQLCLGRAIVFDETGDIVEPSKVLRKRPLIVERGRFHQIGPHHANMLHSAERFLPTEGIELGRETESILEMTLDPATRGNARDNADVVQRVDRVRELGPVVVTNYPQSYLLVDYLRRFTGEPIRLVMGVGTLTQIINERFYGSLPGSLLEGLGKLLATNVKIYAYPMTAAAFRSVQGDPSWVISSEEKDLVTARDVRPASPLDNLYDYLLAAGWLIPIDP